MKKLNIIMLAVFAIIIGFASCYKEQKPPQPFDVLTRHQWLINAYVNGNVDSGADCRMPAEVIFDKDSTGYFRYFISCTPNSPGDSLFLHFRWYTTYDNMNIFFIRPGVGPLICALSFYDDRKLRLRNPNNPANHFMDGYFVAGADR